jgi:hypothetical protein
MNSQNERCPLCGNPPTNYEAGHPTDFVDCRTCGRFRIFDTLDTLKIPADLRPYLSAATRQATGRGELIAISDKNAKELAEPHQRTTVTEKVQKVLYLIAEKTKSPGTDCTIDWLTDYPLIDARNSGELMSYLGHLKENRLADQNASDTARWSLTIEGWLKAQPSAPTGGEPGRCFVASWLDDHMDEPYSNGIDPAVRECGYTPIWMKNVPENKGITDRIISEVRRAEFVVADLTGQRPNVYFEAGFARGLGREVIWCCHADHIEGPDGLHFDVRHFGHVVWRDSVELRSKLRDSIRANIIQKR